MITLDNIKLVKQNDEHTKIKPPELAIEAACDLYRKRNVAKYHGVCPVILSYVKVLNEKISDIERHILLKQYIPILVDTQSTKEIEQKRMFLSTDYACRIFAPLALEAQNMQKEADELRSLSPIVDRQSANAANAAAYAAYAANAANAAAYAAYAANAANAAAYAANAANAAANAAYAAAYAADAAAYAANVAANVAANAAANAVLHRDVVLLYAFQLLDNMIAMT